MAKKTARQRKEESQLRAIQQATANVNRVVARSDAPSAAPSVPAGVRHTAELADEYKYVRSDLRRIALLATSIIVVLIALSFVIR